MDKKDYQEALEWLFKQTPNYQENGKKAYKPGLDNIKKLCDYWGNPQNKIKTIHIGGTNGKGSTSNMLASILQEAGYKVGIYNSPHLVEFTERVKINGEKADKEFVYQFIQKLKQIPEQILPSFFEFTTIMAFEYFYQNEVDFAIIEVGLGDENILVKNIIREKADAVGTEFIDATEVKTDLETDLKGNYQRKNIRVVLALVEVLRKKNVSISDENIHDGLLHVQKNTGFIGRWFEFSKNPLTICDTGHNKAGLDMVFSQLAEYQCYKHIVLGFVQEKNIDEVLRILPRDAHYYFVKPAIHRGRHPKDYENLLVEAGVDFKIFDSVEEGYQSAKAVCKEDEMIFIGGSNFVVGDFLEKNLEVK